MASARLNAIVDMVPNAQTAADIGCDHGKISVSLVKQGKAKSVICTDISDKSLKKAEKLVAQRKLGNEISCRRGDGLKPIEKNEAEVVVVAGMGGELIVDILSEDIGKVPDTLVLSCNTAAGFLRKWLIENGFVIEDEDLVIENRHYYPVILAKRGSSDPLSDMELELGPVIIKKKLRALKFYIKRRIEASQDMKKSLIKSKKQNKENLIAQVDEHIEKYRDVLNWLQR